MKFLFMFRVTCLTSLLFIVTSSLAAPVLDERQISIGIGINITIGEPQVCGDCKFPASQIVSARDALRTIVDLASQKDCTIECPKENKDPAYHTIISTDTLEVNIFFTNRVPEAYRATCPCNTILFKLWDAIPTCKCPNGLVRVYRGLENCDFTDIAIPTSIVIVPPTQKEEFGAAVEVVPQGQHFLHSHRLAYTQF